MKKTFLLPVALLGFAASAQAATVVSYVDTSSSPTVSSTDLINGLTPTVTGSNANWTGYGSGGVPTINNGLYGALGDLSQVAVAGRSAAQFTAGETGDLVWTFASAKDLTTINLYFGWQDTGLDNVPNMSIYTSANAFVSTGTGSAAVTADMATVGGFSLLASTVNTAPTSGSTIMASITSNSGPLVSNVRSIVFRFGTAENDGVLLREIDVLGSAAAVPEPSAALLGGLGALALLRRRRA